MPQGQTNIFCAADNLSNESSVEHFFAIRLLAHLGYNDSQIKTKESIDALRISQGRRRVLYRPDYVVMLQRRPRLVMDAKAATEPLDEWVGQCGSYCHELNKRFEDNPAEYFVLTNGLRTGLYRWDSEQPLLQLDFSDFSTGNQAFATFCRLVGRESLSRRPRANVTRATGTTVGRGEHEFTKHTIDDINVAFARCHQLIYKKDHISQGAAFMEFVKLMFLKLLSDKDVHAKHTSASKSDTYNVPTEDVAFSVAWIERLENTANNPIADISFVQLRRSLEDKIRTEKKKRIFDEHEELRLSAETIKAVVKELEHMDLYSIDADLNGRLFETFLNSTMRGKDLGQYFTPRSVVKLALELGGYRVGRTREDTPTVVDPCCGSGGFLIDAFWNAWAQVDANRSLSAKQKADLKEAIATQKLIGIDVGRDPQIARIARINMYLHGDGGSRVYEADSLDKSLLIDEGWNPEKKKEITELQALLNAEGGCADLILTNPPFSKKYEKKHAPEKRILEEYDLAYVPNTRALKSGVRSNVLFIERYADLLKTGGRVVTIVDDSVLGSSDYREVRDFIRKHFIVEAVVSLPGDAFQRSRARVKTSLLVLRKKQTDEEQTDCFMYYCNHVGLDDTARQRTLPIDRANRLKAAEEIEIVRTLWQAFLQGTCSSKWLVPKSRLTERLDVKSCLPKPQRQVSRWQKAGFKVLPLREMVTVFDEDSLPDADVISTSDGDDEVKFLKIRYDGIAEAGEEKALSDVEYPTLYRVHAQDIVISHINAVHGAIAVVPQELDGFVVSNEYTICRARQGYDPALIWLLARSPESRADLVLLASGMGRTRIRWENARDLALPIPRQGLSAKAVNLVARSFDLARQAEEARRTAETLVYNELGLDNATAQKLISAFKPPK
jgi:type I restriction enzyme M protein